ncbi:hypothetical protein QRX50_22670 [Amycolatopsis carbonis]|uniref:Uncharacterized protein n=1 Tax=Amycolatopsis carbonis TaxID=715471 RepID=A0A9Y2IRS5_9PSEU|nr:hypothetical protein [Amycolatopsis sp. 2-15]WIX84274.1 hypothetical protein QRX50_22670 [Amycolatopsis sp. 2-15]
MAHHPGQPDLARRHAFLLGERANPVHQHEVGRDVLRRESGEPAPRVAEVVDAADLYALIWALHHTAILYPGALRSSATTDPARLRAAVVAAVGRLSLPWCDTLD